MGTRGRLKLVPSQGVPDVGGTAAGRCEPKAPPVPPAVAENSDLGALWSEIVPELDRAGLLSPADGPALELAIRHFAVARQAADELASGSLMLWDEKNLRYMKSPLDVVFRSQSAAFLEYAKQLGMTFAARVRSPHSEGEASGDTNPFIPSSVGG